MNRDELVERLNKEAWAADHDSPGRHKWANLFREAASRITALEAQLAEREAVAWLYNAHTPDGVKRIFTHRRSTHYDGYPITDETPLYRAMQEARDEA